MASYTLEEATTLLVQANQPQTARDAKRYAVAQLRESSQLTLTPETSPPAVPGSSRVALFASAKLSNRCMVRHSSHSLPLKPSVTAPLQERDGAQNSVNGGSRV